MAAQATPVTARTTSTAAMGLASTGRPSRAFVSTRHAGQNPPGLACLVATADPQCPGSFTLIATLRHEIHVVVCDVQHVESTFKSGVGVVDLIAVLYEYADAGCLSRSQRSKPVVVVGLLGLIGKRDATVEVEVASQRRQPWKPPAHPSLVRGKLRVRSPGDGGHRDVPMVQVDGDAVEVVHPERTDEAGRVRRPGRMGAGGVWVEHRVIDDQLAATLEEVAECLAPVLALEGVVIFDEFPRQLPPLPA